MKIWTLFPYSGHNEEDCFALRFPCFKFSGNLEINLFPVVVVVVSSR